MVHNAGEHWSRGEAGCVWCGLQFIAVGCPDCCALPANPCWDRESMASCPGGALLAEKQIGGLHTVCAAPGNCDPRVHAAAATAAAKAAAAFPLAPAEWLCKWPESFATCTTGSGCISCVNYSTLPLWQMLSGQRPGFLQHGELLLRIRVTPVAASPEAGMHSCRPLTSWQGGLCSAPHIGPLGPQPRLLSSPVLNWGFDVADMGLWRSRGFASQRLPGASSAAAARQLEAARQQQLVPAPWMDGVLEQMVVAYSKASVSPRCTGGLPGSAGALLHETAFLVAAAVLLLVCVVAPLAHVGEFQRHCQCWLSSTNAAAGVGPPGVHERQLLMERWSALPSQSSFHARCNLLYSTAAPAAQRAYVQRRARQRHVLQMRQLARQGEAQAVEQQRRRTARLQQPESQPAAGKGHGQQSVGRRAAQKGPLAKQQRQQAQQAEQQRQQAQRGPGRPAQQAEHELQAEQAGGGIGGWRSLLCRLLPNVRQQQEQQHAAKASTRASPAEAASVPAADQPAIGPKTPPQRQKLRRRGPADPAAAGLLQRQQQQQPQAKPQQPAASSASAKHASRPAAAAASPAPVANRRSEDAATLMPALAHAPKAAAAPAAAHVQAAAGAAPAEPAGLGQHAVAADLPSVLLAMLPPEQPPTPGGGGALAQPQAGPQAAVGVATAATPAAAVAEEPHDSELCIGELREHLPWGSSGWLMGRSGVG